jgi:hypothetical protein
MTYDEDYRAALRLQNVMVFSMARMPFRSILHTVLLQPGTRFGGGDPAVRV